MKKRQFKRISIEIFVIIFSGLAIFFCSTHNESLYKQTIGNVVSVKNGKRESVTDEYNNKDYQTTQTVNLQIMNGKDKGKYVELKNTYSQSGALDQKLNKNQKIFIELHHTNGKLTAVFMYSKRDTYLLMLCWLVIVLLYIMMQIKGIRTILSVTINFILFLIFVQLDVNLNITYFFWLFALSALLFTALSLIIVIGWNRQCAITFVAIVFGTTLGLMIGWSILELTNSQGVHYEALDMATQAPKQLFFAATLIGLLGAVMDAATDIVSTLFEMKENTPNISQKQLFLSGRQVGRAIMGPLINVLFLIFFAETFAMAVLYFRTNNTYSFTFAWTMSLGVVQSLISGIGIVLVIPTASYLCSRLLGGK